MQYSYTMLQTFNKCRFLWWLTYIQGIRPAKGSDRLTLGSLVHVGLAVMLRGGTAVEAEAAIRGWEERHTLPAIVFDGVALPTLNSGLADIAISVLHRTVKHLSLGVEWETVLFKGQPIVEMKFTAPLGDGSTFAVVIDWVARHIPTQTVWVFDHKTRTTIQADDEMDWSLQLAIYQKVLAANGVDTVGSITNQIKVTPLAVPKVNKTGGMSKADISTTWEVYKQAVIDNGYNPADYAEMETKLSGKVFNQLSRSYRSEQLLETLWDKTVLGTIREIQIATALYLPSTSAPRNMHTVNCKLCGSALLCQTDLVGGDTLYMIESGAYVRTQHDTLTVEEPENPSIEGA